MLVIKQLQVYSAYCKAERVFVSVVKYSSLTHHFPQCISLLFKYEFSVYESLKY